LGVSSATGGRVATVTVEDALAFAVAEADWAVTLATKVYVPGGSSDVGTGMVMAWVALSRLATADGTCDPADQVMDTGAARTKHEAIVVESERMTEPLRVADVTWAATTLPEQLPVVVTGTETTARQGLETAPQTAMPLV